MVFIVIEGIDGSGKTTQAKALCRGLEGLGYKVTNEKEPTEGVIGRFIRQALQDKVKIDLISLQLLFVADRNEHIKAIHREISNGIVISDRYYYSTIAYGEALGVKRDYLETLNSIFPKPDKTFVLEIEPSEAFKRIDNGRSEKEIFERLETLEKIKRSYDKFKGDEIERINGDKDAEIVTAELLEKTLRLLKDKNIMPV
jgi:dTMP kinase